MPRPAPPEIRWNIHVRDTVRSTMEEIDELAAAGAPEGAVVIAQSQTAGRGRAGRTWAAPLGSALLCSFLLRPPLPPAAITIWPLLLGLATAEACEGVGGVACQLKWPNDVMCDGKKLAGVLVTTRMTGGMLSHVTCGVGVNLTSVGDDLPEGATSVKACTSRTVSSHDILLLLLMHVAQRYEMFLLHAGRPPLDGWVKRASWLGEIVEIDEGIHRRRGIYRGVDVDGALLLETADGLSVRVVAGDLVRGPRLA